MEIGNRLESRQCNDQPRHARRYHRERASRQIRFGAAEHLGNDFTRQRRVALDRNTATYRFGPMKSKVVFIPSKTTIQYRKATAE